MKVFSQRSGIGALLFLALAVTAGAIPARAVLLNVHLYKQCNSAWGGHQLGTCPYTICSHGCAITSMAMVFRYFGGSRDPGQLNACLKSTGGYSGGCSVYWVNNCMPNGVTYLGSSGNINTALEAGRPVIAWVSNSNTSMHFVVIIGNNGGQYQIHDPGWSYTTISAGGYTIQGLRFYSGTQSVCDCSPGQTESQACGDCGTRSRTCQSNCQWGSWSACTGQGICSPGQTESQDCCDCGTQSRSCTSGCQWTDWSPCHGPDPEELISCETGEPGVCAQGVLRCVEGCYACAPLVEPSPEICDGLDNDCNGLVDDGSPTVMGEPPPPYAAALVDLSFPARLEPGERGLVWVIFENVGSTTWGAGDIWLQALAPEGGAGSLLWDEESWPAHDVAAMLTQEVEPGEYAELLFDLRFPQDVQGPVVERFRLLSPQGEAIRCPYSELEVSVAPARGTLAQSLPSAEAEPEASSAAPTGHSQQQVLGGCQCRAVESGAQGLISLLGIALLLIGLRLRRRRFR